MTAWFYYTMSPECSQAADGMIVRERRRGKAAWSKGNSLSWNSSCCTVRGFPVPHCVTSVKPRKVIETMGLCPGLTIDVAYVI